MSAAKLSDATSTIATRLAVEELVYVDNSSRTHPYVLDPAKLSALENFRREIGEELYEFNVTLMYRGEEEHALGPRGPTQPEDRMSGVLVLSVGLFENNRHLPAKLRVVAWR